jgi:hypothetical protein
MGTRPISFGRCYDTDSCGTEFGNDVLNTRSTQAAERESSPQRLKPISLHSSYVRPKGRTLQRIEFFRNL